ncbi:MAG: NlpC/P60 family protein [Thermoleophilia bacterium]|nr:NlpC/P60 family protein [Thermoleophilia bacterium]
MTGQTATGGSVRDQSGARFRSSHTGWTPIVVFLAALAAGLLLAVGPAAADPIGSKRAQAEAIMAEVQLLDSSLAKSIEAYNYADVELDRIDQELVSNGRHLVAARKSLAVAQGRIAERLRDLYVNGESDSTLEVILGSQSLDDIIARLDAIERVSSQDAGILKTVKTYRKEVETRRARLQEARADQARIVSERGAQKASIESRLADRQQLLASVKDEIVQIQAEERARQASLAAQARARVQAQQLAAQAQQDTAQAAYDNSLVAPVYDADVPAARYSHVVSIALQYLGVPYVWGGSSPATGFDCSGFIMYVFAQVGVSLPHHAASQFAYGTPVSRDQLAAGDLVFFDGLGHAGIYIGGGQFVHAPHTGDVVKISSIYDSWYAATWVGGRRL